MCPVCLGRMQEVDAGQVYKALGQRLYRLRSMVCYYGAHYHAFVRADDGLIWRMVDDATTSVVGPWADVVRKCQLGRIQPSVLFFEA